MRRAISVACVLLVIPLVLLFLYIRASLPGDAGPLIREKYSSWSGVLRLWIYEGWEANAVPWLNRAISGFEKGHVRRVDAAGSKCAQRLRVHLARLYVHALMALFKT